MKVFLFLNFGLVTGYGNLLRNIFGIKSLLDGLAYDSHSQCIFSPLTNIMNENLSTIYSTFGAVQLYTDCRFPSKINIIFNGHSFLDKCWGSNSFWVRTSAYIILRPMNLEIDSVLVNLWTKHNVFNAFIYHGESISTYNPATQTVLHLSTKAVRKYLRSRFKNWNESNFLVAGLERESSFELTNSDASGYDGQMMRTIAEHLNFTLKLVIPADGEKYGQRLENRSLLGAFREIVNGNANITMNGHFLKFYDVPELVFTNYVTAEQLCLIVPKGKKISNFLAIFKTFQSPMLVWFLVTYLLAITVFLLLRRFETGTSVNRLTSGGSYTLIYLIILGVPLWVRFQSSFERLIFGSLFLMSLIISNFFQSSLVTVSNSPLYNKNPSTLDEVGQSRLEIWISSLEILDNFKNDGDLRGLNFKLKSKMESISSTSSDSIGRTIRVNVLTSSVNQEYKGVKTVIPKHVVHECIGTYTIAYLLPVGSPLFNEINEIISKTVENGIVSKWIADRKGDDITKAGKDQEANIKALGIEEFYVPFGLLSLGLLISIVVFIGELIL